MSAHESFFRLARSLCYATRFLGVNGFSFPPHRGKGMKLHIDRWSLASLVVPTVILFTLDAIRITVTRIKKQTSSASQIIDSVDLVKIMTLIFLGRVQALTNIFLDVINRRKIWSIICGLCDFDIVVSTIFKHTNRL